MRCFSRVESSIVMVYGIINELVAKEAKIF